MNLQPTAAVSDRHDHLDAERFRDMVLSPPFQILRRRIEAELERQRTECERQEDESPLRQAQGAVAALRTVLALPTIILGEIERAKK
jgi:hypothetical protein